MQHVLICPNFVVIGFLWVFFNVTMGFCVNGKREEKKENTTLSPSLLGFLLVVFLPVLLIHLGHWLKFSVSGVQTPK